VLADEWSATAIAGFVFGDFNFYDQSAPTVAIPLTNADSLTESPDGTYTIDQASLLTAGHTYDLKIAHDKYDVAVGEVAVAAE